MPSVWRSIRPHRPPMERGGDFKQPHALRIDAHFGMDRPAASPASSQARCTACAIASCICGSRREGVTYKVSSKYGPSSGSGLSIRASTRSRPSCSSPSRACSLPAMNCSTTKPSSTASRSALAWMARTRSHRAARRLAACRRGSRRGWPFKPARLDHHGKSQRRRQIGSSPRCQGDGIQGSSNLRAAAGVGTPACRAHAHRFGRIARQVQMFA